MKQAKRVFAALLCLVLMMGMMPAAASAAAKAVLDENFDAMTTGAEPTGWTVNAVGESAISAKVESVSSAAAANRALLLSDQSTAATSRGTVTFAAQSKIFVSFDYRLGTVSVVNAVGLFNGGTTSSQRKTGIGVFPGEGGTGILKYINSAGQWTVSDAPALKAGVWYNIRLVIDESKNAVLYLDGREIAAFVTRNVAEVDRMIAQSNNAAGTGDMFWIDNVVIKTEAGADHAVVSEDFESVSVGSIPGGWSRESDDKALVEVVSENAGSAKALFVQDASTVLGPARAVYVSEASTDAELSFDYRLGSANGVNAIGLFNGGTASNQRKAGIGIFENADGTGRLTTIGAANWTTVDGITLQPCVWYSFRLVLSGSSAAVLYMNGTEIARFAVKNLSTVDRVVVQTNNAASIDDAFWLDNFVYTTGAGTYSQDFEDVVSGALPAGWTREAAEGTETGAWVVDMPCGSGKALRLEDNSAVYSEPVRAGYVFAASDDVDISFDYLLESVSGVNAFGTFAGSFASGNKKVSLGVFPNGDGTGVLRYFDVGAWKWINTPLTVVRPNTWYNIRFVQTVGASTARMYVDGVYLGDVYANAAISAADRLVFQSNNQAGVGDVFWIDNVKIIGPQTVTDGPEAFTDTFASADELDDYTVTGTAAVADGVLKMTGTAAAERDLGAVRSGRFGFTVTIDDSAALEFGLAAGDQPGFCLSAEADGTLRYKRDSRWIEFTDPGAIKAGETAEIVIDLPLERNVDYARVYVNGEYVGMALYSNSAAVVNGLYMRVGAGASAVIDNVWAAESMGIFEMPERTEADPVVYVPEVLDGAVLYLGPDTDPAAGVLAPASGGAYIDAQRVSIGVDLGEKQPVNALRIYDNDDTVTSRANQFTVWQSDDNTTWTQVDGFSFNRIVEDGKCQVLFEFSGVEARYVKVNTTRTEASGSIRLTDVNTCIRAERRIARQWVMAGTVMQAQNDTAPARTAMTRVYKEEELTITTGDSVGINFGIGCPVEAIELTGIGLDDLGADAFRVYTSNDNRTFTQIQDVTLSRGAGTLRLTFDSVVCGYLKLYAAGEGINAALTSLADGLRAYSSREILSGETIYPGDRGAEGDFYTLPDGTLIMGYNGFGEAHGDFSDATLNARASTDGGYTWGDEWVVMTKQEGSVNVMQSTYLWLENGDLLFFNLEKETTNICNVYMRRSSDEGKTWSEPVLVTSEPQGYTITSSGNRALRLSTGRILLPVNYCAVTNDAYGADRAVSYVWYSDDDGATWHRSRDAVTLPNAALEPCLAELKDGSVLMSLRTRQEGKIYQTISADGGDTWAQAEAIGVVSPSATNTVMSVPSTGDIALFWNNEYSASNGSRRPLTMAVSADDGLTYKNVRNIVDMSYGTPWPAVAFYGRSVLLMYGDETNLRIFDVAELYHTTSGAVTVADLPQAATPACVYDVDSGWLTGTTADMLYSIDGGKTWTFAGGTSVLIDPARLNQKDGILVKDNGTASTAPSEIQAIEVDLTPESLPVVGTARNGTVLANGVSINRDFAYGMPVALTFTADEGYVISDVRINGRSIGAVSSYGIAALTESIAVDLICVKDDGSGSVHNCLMSRFTDCDADAWYHEYVDAVLEAGLFDGVSDTKFAPTAPMTRGMLMTVLYRMEGCPAVSGKSAFRDVQDADAWYYDAVIWAAQNGIVDGYGDNTFRPGKELTREELAAILYRYADAKPVTADMSRYTDWNDVSGWAADAVRWAAANGIMEGVTDSTLSPGTSAQRVQVAAMLLRLLEK